MATDGYVLRLDMGEIKKMIQLLKNSSSNLNQIARKTNSTGSISMPEIQAIKEDYNKLWEQVDNILIAVSNL